MDSIRTAMAIFKVLMEKGQLARENSSELFVRYSEPEIQDILNEMSEEMDCELLRIKDTIYLIPDYDNALLGFRNKDAREWIGANARMADVFLGYYMTALILNLFYGGKNRDPKQREFLNMTTIIEELDARIQRIFSNEEKTAEMEKEYSLNFKSIAMNWDSKRVFEDGSRISTKLGFLLKVLRLLQLEGLIQIAENEKEIRTTRKLDDLMIHYYLNDSRINELHEIFKEEQ